MNFEDTYNDWIRVTRQLQPSQYLRQLSTPMCFTPSHLPHSNVTPPQSANASREVMAVPAEKPKRNLSAYNFFFKQEREKILAGIPEPSEDKQPKNSHGKIGFAKLARTIAAKWRNLDDEERALFDALAARDKERYIWQLKQWKNGIPITQPFSQGTPSTATPVDPVRKSELLNCSSTLLEEPTLSESSPQGLDFAPSTGKHDLQTDVPCVSDLILNLDKESQELLISTFLV